MSSKERKSVDVGDIHRRALQVSANSSQKLPRITEVTDHPFINLESPYLRSNISSKSNHSSSTPKINDKEERFKNKYRWAEKKQKFRTGKCEGYSFYSIKAGLRRQDFLDTIQWSPANHAAESHHLADVVHKLIHQSQDDPVQKVDTIRNHTIEMNSKNDAPQTTSSTGSPEDIEISNKVAAFMEMIGNRIQANSSGQADSQQSDADGNIMSEEDFRIATGRKISKLRVRGSNTLSSRMNLDSFIDSALSSQAPTEDKLEHDEDLSLQDLQSPKLIDSRFGWSKVRRAVTAAAQAKSAVKNFQAKIVAPVSPNKKDEAEVQEPPAKEEIEAQLPPRPSTATTRIGFTVPVTATIVRPKSAIVYPTSSGLTTIVASPVHDFAEVVKQELHRPVSASVDTLKSVASIPSTASSRPRTATLRIAPPPADNNNNEIKLIDAMLGAGIVNEPDKQAILKHEKKLYDKYDGLFYKDSGKSLTWNGVDRILSPPPYLRQQDDGDSVTHMFSNRSDLRWAGKTLNCYRPWSPIRQTPVARHNSIIGSSPYSAAAVLLARTASPSSNEKISAYNFDDDGKIDDYADSRNPFERQSMQAHNMKKSLDQIGNVESHAQSFSCGQSSQTNLKTVSQRNTTPRSARASASPRSARAPQVMSGSLQQTPRSARERTPRSARNSQHLGFNSHNDSYHDLGNSSTTIVSNSIEHVKHSRASSASRRPPLLISIITK